MNEIATSVLLLICRLDIRGETLWFPKRDRAATKFLIRHYFQYNLSINNNVSRGKIQVSLICPIGLKRITVPCRSVSCLHVQCFDLATYMKTNAQNPAWKCPICQKRASLALELKVDEYFLDILKSPSTQNEESVLVERDGSWKPLSHQNSASSQPMEGNGETTGNQTSQQPTTSWLDRSGAISRFISGAAGQILDVEKSAVSGRQMDSQLRYY